LDEDYLEEEAEDTVDSPNIISPKPLKTRQYFPETWLWETLTVR